MIKKAQVMCHHHLRIISVFVRFSWVRRVYSRRIIIFNTPFPGVVTIQENLDFQSLYSKYFTFTTLIDRFTS